MKSALGWIPIILFALFAFRREQIGGLTGWSAWLGLSVLQSGLICFLLLPAFLIYQRYAEEFSHKRSYFQIFLFSLLTLYLFQRESLSQYYEDSLLMVLGALYLISFNLLYSNLGFLHQKLNILKEKQKFDIFKKYPPTCRDDLLRPKLFFAAVALIPFVVNLYWKVMMGD